MTQLLAAYAAAAIIFFALDMLWLGVVVYKFYRDAIGHLMAPRTNWVVALGFYLIYLVGLVYFAIAPALPSTAVGHAALDGALFGFFAYATYHLTNLSTLRDYPVRYVAVDLAWGTFLSGTAAAGATYVAGRLIGA